MAVSVSTSNSISGHTKVILPHEEAIKAPFPPGCKVLCFDEHGFRVGVVSDVLVFISLHEEATYGTYYEVEIKGSNLQAGKTSVFTATDLRLTPDCPVSVNPEYFGSVFNTESEGKIEGVVLGSFELPPTMCSSCSDTPHKTGQFFYSVRVRFPGMDEAVEAHGVPPEYVMALPNGSDTYKSPLFRNGSIMIGGGSYKQHDDRPRSNRGKPKRVTPEDIQTEEDFENESVRDGYYQEQYEEESYQGSYRNKNDINAKIKNIITNSDSHFYDTADDSEIVPQRQSPVKKTSSRGRSTTNNDNVLSRSASTRSISRTRTYVRSQTPTRSISKKKLPSNQKESGFSQSYGNFKDSREKRSNANRDEKYYEEKRDIMSSEDNEIPANESEKSDSYDEEPNNRKENTSYEEYDAETFQESDDDEIPPIGQISSVSSFSRENQSPNVAETKNSTLSRTKAFGKTWEPTNQITENNNAGEIDEKPKIGKLHIGARGATPLKVRSTSPQPSTRMSNDERPTSTSSSSTRSSSKLPPANPTQGCYLIFDLVRGDRFITQYSHTVVEDAVGFWAPGKGKKLQGFKFKQNEGKSDLMKGIAGKDYKKKYYSGWCQFVKAAKSLEGSFAKYSKPEHMDVDIYIFYGDTCEVEQVVNGQLFDVSSISAVSCISTGNTTFDGVKTSEYGTFLNKGAAAGASLAL